MRCFLTAALVLTLLLSAVSVVLANDGWQEGWDPSKGLLEGFELNLDLAKRTNNSDTGDTVSLAGALGTATGCHQSDDSAGAKCKKPFREINFKAVARSWCASYIFPVKMCPGQSYEFRMTSFPCDADGKTCEFWGNIRVDRVAGNPTNVGKIDDGFLYWTESRCIEHIDTIWKNCGGNGGWKDTNYGTIFMECHEPIPGS